MKVGDIVPDFELPDETGTTRRLGDLVSTGPVVLYFYPAAMTPGCTKESCHFRDVKGDLESLGAHPVGISADPMEKQQQFTAKYHFGFPLLSDTDQAVAKTLGAARPLKMLGNRRMTFVIGTDRKVLGVIKSEVAMNRHADEAMEILRKSGAAAPPAG